MEYVYLILQLLGGLGAFLVGMEIMSDSMSRLAHGGLKKMLNKTANNRFAGVGIGAVSTIIIQSSSASFSQRAAEASEGIRQSPRGERETEPTLTPSGTQLRLNCCAKKRL